MSPTATDIEVIPATWSADRAELAAIRREVFVEEQRVPEALEWDGEDAGARHWLALVEGRPAGTVRLLRGGHVGRMAVRRRYRSAGVGSALLRSVIAAAREQNLRELYLHAQTHAIEFYARHGFEAEGPEFMDAGMPHRTLRLALRARRLLGQDHGKFAAIPRAAALDLARQTRRRLRILSHELDAAIYGHDDFAEAVSKLVRGYRNAEVRLLIVDSSALTPGKHALLALQRRLSSAIRIRRVGAVTESLEENYLVADGRGLLCYSAREPAQAWADYNNAPLANEYEQRFDELWQHAAEDPNLRVLDL